MCSSFLLFKYKYAAENHPKNHLRHVLALRFKHSSQMTIRHCLQTIADFAVKRFVFS